MLFQSIALNHVEARLAAQIAQIFHHCVNFVRHGALIPIFLLPGEVAGPKVHLLLDKLASFEERSHLLSLLRSHAPLLEGFSRSFAMNSLSQVLRSHSTVFFIRRKLLPCGKPVARRLLFNSSALHSDMVLLNVCLLYREVILHHSHLLSRLHLQHANVFVLLLPPFTHGSLESILAVKAEHAT